MGGAGNDESGKGKGFEVQMTLRGMVKTKAVFDHIPIAGSAYAMQMIPTAASALADADLCVKCGLCLPHCPTYRLTQHEADGPRGRIALSQALLSGVLPAGASLTAHLDGCLSCRACEAVCPAKVPYGRVLDTARATLATPERTRLTRLMGIVLDSAVLRFIVRIALRLASLLLDHGRIAQHLPRWLHARPVVGRVLAVPAPAQATLALFTGCVGDIAERAVLHDAARLFKAAGVTVAIPPDQGCCGALYQHGGLAEAAAARAARNAQAFAACEVVLPLASGCGAALRDLGHEANATAGALSPKVRDLCTALAEALDAKSPAFQPRRLRVGIHTACTQVHVFGAKGAVRRLLTRIPGIELVDLAPESGCCGAAGTAFITQPQQAERLLQPKLDAASTVDVVVSANIGCSLHLLAGLRGRGRSVPVLHPVSLLAQALAD